MREHKLVNTTHVRTHGVIIPKAVWYTIVWNSGVDSSALAGWSWGTYQISESHFLTCKCDASSNRVPPSGAGQSVAVLLHYTPISTLPVFPEGQSPWISAWRATENKDYISSPPLWLDSSYVLINGCELKWCVQLTGQTLSGKHLPRLPSSPLHCRKVDEAVSHSQSCRWGQLTLVQQNSKRIWVRIWYQGAAMVCLHTGCWSREKSTVWFNLLHFGADYYTASTRSLTCIIANVVRIKRNMWKQPINH